MQHHMQDLHMMFKVYKHIGGGTTFDKYSQHLKLFFYHTLNSHVFGMGPADYDRGDGRKYLCNFEISMVEARWAGASLARCPGADQDKSSRPVRLRRAV